MKAAKTSQPMTINALTPKSASHFSSRSFHAFPDQQQEDKKENKTGLPDKLKAGIENLSGISLDDVKVHYHSSKPSQLDALAYTQGINIYIAPGQEEHLPHEAWHLVQQKKRQVKPTLQIESEVKINDDEGLEKEADEMGAKAMSLKGLVSNPNNAMNFDSERQNGSPNDIVVQRVYLYDGKDYTFVQDNKIPKDYVRTGKYDDGKNGSDALFQKHDLVNAENNPFFAQQGYGKAQVEDRKVLPQDLKAESSPEESNDFFLGSMKNQLDKSKKDSLKEPPSSDSEEAAGNNPERQTRRRHFKASQLNAIIETLFPLSDQDKQFHEATSEKMKQDIDAQSGNRQRYGQDTRVMHAQIGEQFKQTSFLHNPYLRRALREAVPNEKVDEGGSENYTKYQGKIRAKLKDVITADFKKMGWRRGDFPSDKSWDGYQFIQNNIISNDSTKVTYQEQVESKKDTSGSTAKNAIHHVGFKEAKHGELADYALTPSNLTLLNDSRAIHNPKKIEKKKEKGDRLPDAGAHEAYGHDLGSLKEGDKRSEGGGMFKDIDLETVNQILRVLTEPRERKSKLYQVENNYGSDPSEREKGDDSRALSRIEKDDAHEDVLEHKLKRKRLNEEEDDTMQIDNDENNSNGLSESSAKRKKLFERDEVTSAGVFPNANRKLPDKEEESDDSVKMSETEKDDESMKF
jgi:hypothetical protein